MDEVAEMKVAEIREDSFLIEYHRDGLNMEFRAFEVEDWDGPVYHRGDSLCRPAPTRDRSAAQSFVSGHVRSDGCMNVDFDEPMMLHFCSRKQAGAVGRLLERLYDLARECFPDHDPDDFV
jgi:hypothetical protein